MHLKTYVIIFLSVAITIIFMQNLDPVPFKVLWMEFTVAKLVMMLVVTVFGFILGVIVARPRKKKLVEMEDGNIPFEINQTKSDEYAENPQKNTLSDEDRDYIN